MRRLRYLTLMGLLGISLTAAEIKPYRLVVFRSGLGQDEARGFEKIVSGVAGQALRFDGQTTAVVRPAAMMPRIGGAFSVEAWVALQTYPWTWCAIANQEKDRRAGYFFGVDPEGRFGLQVSPRAEDGKNADRTSACRSIPGTISSAPSIRPAD